jgi:hypothetical protein
VGRVGLLLDCSSAHPRPGWSTWLEVGIVPAAQAAARGCSVWSLGWGGGEVAVGVSLQPPAALVDRAVVGPAQQGQVGLDPA